MSILDKISLPGEFGLILLVFSFILMVSPYFSGSDFGIFKVPKFPTSTRRSLLFLGPVAFVIAITIHIPLLEDEEAIVISEPSEWQEIIGTINEWQAVHSLVEASGEFFVAGQYEDAGWLLKLDLEGKQVWQRRIIGPRQIASFSDISSDTDGGALLVGYIGELLPSSHDGWIVKVDADGQEKWQLAIGGPERDELIAVSAYSDGGVLAAGFITVKDSSFPEMPGVSSTEGLLIKFDSLGREEWRRTFFGPERANAEFRALAISEKGEILLAGWTEYEDRHGWLVKVDSLGEEIWRKSFEAPDAWSEFHSIGVDGNGDFVLAGSIHRNSGAKAWLLKVDDEGEEIWRQEFLPPKRFGAFRSVAIADGNEIVAVGVTGFDVSDGENNSDGWILRVDGSGREIWRRLYGQSGANGFFDLAPIPSGGYIVAGRAETDQTEGTMSGWVIQVDEAGNRLQ